MPSTHLEKALEAPSLKMYRWKAHNDWIEQITIDRRLNQIISCSNDENNAVIIGCILPSTDVNSHLQAIEKQNAAQAASSEVSKESKDSNSNQSENTTFLNTSFDAANKRNSTVGNTARISTPKQTQDQQTQNTAANMTVSSNSRDVKRRPDVNETVFKVNKGVKTFDFSFEKNILITGGMLNNFIFFIKIFILILN